MVLRKELTCWEKRDITVRPVTTYTTYTASYLFVWQDYAVSLSSFFRPSFCYSSRAELKCKAGMNEPVYHWHIIKWRQ